MKAEFRQELAQQLDSAREEALSLDNLLGCVTLALYLDEDGDEALMLRGAHHLSAAELAEFLREVADQVEDEAGDETLH